LGLDFLEKVYERALMREFALRGISAEAQLMVELKYVEQFANEPYAQCLNYLWASGSKTCLLVNFQKPKVEGKRLNL
jgi:hypothetical protein